jgi:hypothetical protein
LHDRRSNSSEDIAREILSFFLRRPGVTDSFNGIARWRLMEDAVDRNVAATEEALLWLIESGFLSEARIAGCQSVFQLNPEKRGEAINLVNSGKGRDRKNE